MSTEGTILITSVVIDNLNPVLHSFRVHGFEIEVYVQDRRNRSHGYLGYPTY
jgi:hypothetical protein